jgi:hypothetical protein
VLVNRMLRFLPAVIAQLDRGYPWRVRCRAATLYLSARAATPPCPAQS